MTQSEHDLYFRLSAKAAEPSPEFATTLRRQLQQREKQLRTQTKAKRRHIVNINKLALGFASIAVLSLGGFATFKVLQEGETSLTQQQPQSQTNNSTTQQASSLPNQQSQSLDEARKSLSFEPLVSSVKLAEEALSDIRVGTKSNMIDDSDTLYLTYAGDSSTLYKIAQSTKTFNDPTDTAPTPITFLGKKVEAKYYFIGQPEGGSASPNSAGTQTGAPTSYLFWKVDGVRYEISEFGELEKGDLVRLASSLQVSKE